MPFCLWWIRRGKSLELWDRECSLRAKLRGPGWAGAPSNRRPSTDCTKPSVCHTWPTLCLEVVGRGSQRDSNGGSLLKASNQRMTSDSGTDITAAPRWTSSPFPWFALQVRTRHEQGIASRLRTMGYEEFLPIYQCRKSWSDRTKVVAEPLFPSYLFCRFDPQNRLPILQIPGVIQVIGCNKRPIPVVESEIRAVQALVASRFVVQHWPF